MTLTDGFTVDRAQYKQRQAERQRAKRANAVTDLQAGPWTEEETAVALRTDIFLVEKMAILQRGEFDIKNQITRANGIPAACQQCGTTFMSIASCTRNGVTSYRKYCSKACQHEARRTLSPILCGHCGTVFKPRTVSMRFCSRTCGWAKKRGKPLKMPLRSHCKRGHEFTPENTKVWPRGVRVCVTCYRVKLDQQNARRRTGPAAKKVDGAARLARWAELGKTYEAIAVLAAEFEMSEKSMKQWLVTNGAPLPDGRRVSPRRFKTHCKRGHEFTPENTRIDVAGGFRICKVCSLMHSRAAEAKLSAKNKAKTHCSNGHEYNAENTAYTRKGWRTCRQCPREQAQRAQELKESK